LEEHEVLHRLAGDGHALQSLLVRLLPQAVGDELAHHHLQDHDGHHRQDGEGDEQAEREAPLHRVP
jgi:hypothetical protein